MKEMNITIYTEDVNQQGNVIAGDRSVCLVHLVPRPDRFPKNALPVLIINDGLCPQRLPNSRFPVDCVQTWSSFKTKSSKSLQAVEITS